MSKNALIQDVINSLDEMRVLSHQLAHTFSQNIAENDMDADQWHFLQEGIKSINLRSQEAFLNVANLRRNTAEQ